MSGGRSGGHLHLRPARRDAAAFADEAGTTILAIGGTPGEAYEPDGWELWMPVAPLYNDGRYAEAAGRTRELASAHPQAPMLTSMLGRLREQGGVAPKSRSRPSARPPPPDGCA